MEVVVECHFTWEDFKRGLRELKGGQLITMENDQIALKIDTMRGKAAIHNKLTDTFDDNFSYSAAMSLYLEYLKVNIEMKADVEDKS